jgi:hypothetical protein
LDLSLCGTTRQNLVQDIQVMSSMLQRKGMRVVLSRVPSTLVHKLGNAKTALKDIRCMDIFAPYYCPICEQQVAVLLPLSAKAAQAIKENQVPPSTITCESCHSEMKFNDDPKSFFSFLDFVPVFDPVGMQDSDVRQAILDAGQTNTRDRGNISQNLGRHVWWLRLEQTEFGGPRVRTSQDKNRSLETGFAIGLLALNLGLFIWLVSRMS